MRGWTAALATTLLVLAGSAWAFPENVRQGYFSCSSCHVSITGGGVLSEYGRRASEEFMATWAREGQADFLHGAVKLPPELSIGGDVRFLSVQSDNRITRTAAGFPMQADLELAWQPFKPITAVAAAGTYDGKADVRRAYLLYQASENWQTRVGRFFPAFGILNPDHSLLARRLLGFDERQENMNVEGAFTSERFELVADAILGGKDEGDQEREQGYSLRASTFVGERSTLGLSYLHGKGPVWERDAVGPFAMIGFSNQTYLLSELYYQSKKPVEGDDPSTLKHAALISSSRAGHQLTRGVQLFLSFESAESLDGSYVSRQRVYGPGMQWIPVPHLEFYGKLERRLDQTYSPDYGYQALLVSHYWF